MFQKTTKEEKPLLFFISFKSLNRMMGEIKEKLLPAFLELHNEEAKEKI